MERRSYLRAVVAGVAGLAGCQTSGEEGPGPSPTRTTGRTTTEDFEFRIETVTMELEVPWGAAFGPDGGLYLTERPGRIRRVQQGQDEVVADFTDAVVADGEGGLLGLAFHPHDPGTAYTFQTYRGPDGPANRVVRHRVDDGFAAGGPLLDGLPAASINHGGRLAIGPEDALYVTCGDATRQDLVQDTAALAGKVLRLTPAGDPHPDNPFGNAVFTYGHRDPQGLAFGDGGRYGTESGPDHDEINVLEAGTNYGWPDVMGSSDHDAYADPIAAYTPPIEPAGAAVYDGPIDRWRGDLFVGTLAGRHLRRVRIRDDDVVEQEVLLDERYGRLRSVFTGPDGHLYVTTSNRDGRGTPAPQDDRVLSIRPA